MKIYTKAFLFTFLFFYFFKGQTIETKILTPIVNKASKETAAKYGLVTFAFGTFGPHEGFDFNYLSNKKINIEQARCLIINFIEDLLTNVNKRIEKLSGISPLTAENFHILIGFEYPNGEIRQPPDGLGSVTSIRNRIRYSEFHKDNGGLKSIYRESFKEAVEKIKKF